MVDFAEHQKNAIIYQQQHPYNLLAMATGTGKTLTTIGSMLMNLQQQKLNKCIFFCTKGSLGEVKKDFNKFYSFTPTELKDVNNIRNFFESDKTVAVSRYEWLKHFDLELMQYYSENNQIGMWWDEAQRLKNGSKDKEGTTGTKVHKYAKSLRPFCSAFSLVTATPIMCSLDDLWGLMHLVNPNVLKSYDTFCNNFYERKLVPHPRYRNRKRTCPTCGSKLYYHGGYDYCSNQYCKSVETPMGFIPYRNPVRSIWELVEYKNIEVLSKILQEYMFCFFPKQDIRYIIHDFDLSEETLVRYNSIAKDLLNDTDKKTPFATRLIELQYVVDRSVEKKTELYKLANELKSKGFVLYMSLYDTEGEYDSETTLTEILEVLKCVDGLEVRTYSGKDKDDERDEAKEWFQSGAEGKCLIITEAGGASLNLQQTDQFVFYSMPSGFGKISQALGRIVRLFSNFKTFYIHIIQGKNTVDEYKYICFLMLADLVYKLMNNQLIELKAPINYNSTLKSIIRNKSCWKNI